MDKINGLQKTSLAFEKSTVMYLGPSANYEASGGYSGIQCELAYAIAYGGDKTPQTPKVPKPKVPKRRTSDGGGGTSYSAAWCTGRYDDGDDF